jgi:hypothetical protein
MGFFDLKLIIIIALTLICYFIYKELLLINKKISYSYNKITNLENTLLVNNGLAPLDIKEELYKLNKLEESPSEKEEYTDCPVKYNDVNNFTEVKHIDLGDILNKSFNFLNTDIFKNLQPEIIIQHDIPQNNHFFIQKKNHILSPIKEEDVLINSENNNICNDNINNICNDNINNICNDNINNICNDKNKENNNICNDKNNICNQNNKNANINNDNINNENDNINSENYTSDNNDTSENEIIKTDYEQEKDESDKLPLEEFSNDTNDTNDTNNKNNNNLIKKNTIDKNIEILRKINICKLAELQDIALEYNISLQNGTKNKSKNQLINDIKNSLKNN